VSRNVKPCEEDAPPVVEKLHLKKKKSVNGSKVGGSLGRVTVTQRAVSRSDHVLELMIGDLEKLKLEIRSMLTVNKENSSAPADTRRLHNGVKRLDFRAHQLDKAQAQLRKAWNNA
jgi:hypothetical protein